MRGGYAKLLAERQYRLPLHIIIMVRDESGLPADSIVFDKKKKKRKRGIDLVERASIKNQLILFALMD